MNTAVIIKSFTKNRVKTENPYCAIVFFFFVCMIFICESSAANVTSFSPTDDSTDVFVKRSLKITFDSDVSAGYNHIYIKKTSDNSTFEGFYSVANVARICFDSVLNDFETGRESFFIHQTSNDDDSSVLPTIVGTKSFSNYKSAYASMSASSNYLKNTAISRNFSNYDSLITWVYTEQGGLSGQVYVIYNDGSWKWAQGSTTGLTQNGWTRVVLNLNSGITKSSIYCYGFQLQTGGNIWVDRFAVKRTSGTRTVTIIPTNSFAANTSYYVLIDNGAINNYSGIPSSTTTWNFRTNTYRWDVSTDTGFTAGSGQWWSYWSVDGISMTGWPGSGNAGTFGGTDGTYNVDISGGSTQIDSMAFAASGYTISNGNLSIGASNSYITVASGKTATLSVGMQGNNGMKVNGGGTLVLSGSNTFNGDMTNYGTTIRLANSNAAGSNSKTIYANTSGSKIKLSGGITIDNTKTFDLSGTDVLHSVNGSNTIAGNINCNAGVGHTGIYADTGSLTISGNISISDVTNRTVYLMGIATGTVSGVMKNNGSYVLSMIKDNSGTWTMSGTNTYTGGSTINSGIINANNSSAFGTGSITMNGGQIIIGSGYTLSNALTINTSNPGAGKGAIQGPTSGYGYYNGAITINASTTNGGHFGANSSATTTSGLFVNGAITAGDTSVVVSQRMGTIFYSGGGSFNHFVHKQDYAFIGVNNGLSAASDFDIGVDGAAYFDLNGKNQTFTGIKRSASNTAAITNSSGTASTLTLNVASTYTYSGDITANVALVKQGSGKQVLGGTNTYTGTTTISAGELQINGSTASGSSVVVASGATLSGTGTVAGSITVGNGGIISPGASSAATLNTGAIALSNTSVLNFDIGTTSDKIAVTGNLTLDGVINIAAGTGFTYGTYTILTCSGTLSDNTLTVGTVPSGYTATVSVSGNNVLLTVKANQTITFGALATKTYGDAAFSLGATASSGLGVTYASNNTSVATVSGSTVTIVGAGSAIITASQAGNSNYNAAPDVQQTLTVNKASQTITFGALASKNYGDAPFSLTATASSGGAVTYASSNTSVATVSGSTVTITGVGSTIITASQAGTSNFNAASDVQQTLTVGKGSQTITFGALAAKTFGDGSFSLTASASSGLGVTYTSSNTSVATVSGSTVTIVGGGSATITASQSGNSYFNAASDVAQTLTVNTASQTITFGALATKTYGDGTFTLGATSSAGLTIAYTSSNTGVATVSGNIVTIVGAGTSEITASQPGNSNYSAAVSVAQTLTVNKANQTITFGALATKTYGDGTFSLGATASSGLGVSYASSNTSVATVSGSIVTIVGAGSTTITASQTGNTNYNAAADVAQTLTVNKSNQTITFGALASKTFGDADFGLGATASSGLGVIYTSSNTDVATVSGSTVTIVGAGSTTITASQTGNANYNAAADVQQTLTVNAQAQTITFGALASRTYGDAPFVLGATASSGLAVTYASSNTGVATVSGSTVTIVGAGSTTITASQSGNTDFSAAPDATQTLTVNKAAQTISFGALADKPYGSADFPPGATASSGLSVSYSSSNTSVATIVDGKIHVVAPGNTTITASQLGDGNYNGATSVDQSFTVVKGDQTISFGALADKPYASADFDPGATTSSGLPVSYTSSNTSVATIVDGKVHVVALGTTTITALQAGDVNYNAATGVGQPLNIVMADQTITFGAIAAKTYGGADFSLTATASSGLAVAYTSSNTGVATISGNTVTIIAAGTSTITASQGGNGNFNAAADVQQTLTVNKADQTITFTDIPIKAATDPDFTVVATASSGLPVTFTSSNTAVATVSGDVVHLIGINGFSTITASQAGNSNFNAAPDVGKACDVGQASQIITFPNLPVTQYNDADFSPGATSSSGLTVTYASDNASVATIVSGKIHVVGIGTATITASQAGDATYFAADDVAKTLTVGKDDQTITFGALDSKTFQDANFELSATASSTLPVTFASDNAAVATVSGNTVTITGAGTATITASQGGNSYYNAAPDVNQTLTVGQKSQTITFGALADKAYGDADYAPGATASSGLTVTYSSSNTAVATIAAGLIHIVGSGTTTITASQAGNTNFIAAADVNQTLNVGQKSQTITFGALAVKTYGDADFTLGATASSGLTVSYSSDNTSVATVSGNTVTIVGAGSAKITASQSGNTDYSAAADVEQTLTVNKAAQTVTFAALAARTYGDAAFTLGATASSGLTVSYSSDNTAVATVSGNTVTIVGAGSSKITASQSGNTNYNAAADVEQTLTVHKADQTISFSALANKPYGSVDFLPGATASSGLEVAYSSSDPLVATISGGKIHVVAPGNTTITASQAGDDNFNAAVSKDQSLTVVKANQTITFPALSVKNYGDADYDPGATASSTLTVSYSSSNPLVATIVAGQIHITGTGTATITASQAGDANFNAAPYVERVLTVDISAQSITFNPLAAKKYGDADYDPGAFASSGLPVSYTSNNPSVATIVSGQIHITGTGSVTITASQAGNSNFSAAANVLQTLTVEKGDQTITFGALAAKAYGDADFPLGATASSGLTVSYSSSNTGVATVSGNNVTIVGAGSTTITASQAGNSNYNAAANVSQTLMVNKAAQTITFNALDAKKYGDGSFTLSATASSGLAVTYSSSNTSVATVSGNTVTITGVGSAIITASQSGNANYSAASDVLQTLTVNKADQTISFAAIANKPYGSADFLPGATASSGLAVSYSSSNTDVATIVSGKIHVVAPGTATITASQAGDDNYNAASPVDQSFTVVKADQTITFPVFPVKGFGDADFNPGATASSYLTVSYASSNESVATIAAGQIHIVGTGTTTITASQAGDANYNAAADVNQDLSINKKSQTITFGALSAKTYGDADFTVSATASSTLGVSYSSSNTAIAAVSGNTVTITGAGIVNIIASQAGDENYNAAEDVSQTLTINKADQTITFGALTAKTYGDADYAPGATASSSLTVTYTSDNPAVAAIEGGQIHITGAGTATITASQAGDANYNAAPDVLQTLTVNKAGQTITFGELAAKTYGDGDYSPGATASSGLTVTYTSDNPAVATIVNDQIHITGAGSAIIKASQAGNNNFTAAADVSRTLTVGKASQTITFGALPSKICGDADFAPGATASSGLTVTYTSSNTSAATIVSGQIHILTSGTTVITAAQAGNANYSAAADVTQTLTIDKISQTITFSEIPAKQVSDTDFTPLASATSGLPVTFTSSNNVVATIESGKVHIAGAGTAVITASQAGNEIYAAAADVTQTLTVSKLSQTITFNEIPAKQVSDTDFTLIASATSGLSVTFTSSNSAVATITDGKVHLTGVGTSVITASQPGNETYAAALDVTQTLSVGLLTQTITFDTLTQKTYGDDPFTVAATASSGLVVSLSSSDTAVASVLNDTLFIRGAGIATITASQGGGGQYGAASSVERILTVNKKGLVITVHDTVKAYSEQNPLFTYSISGFVNGDDSPVIDTKPVLSTTATVESPVGTYVINAAGAADNNYSFTVVPGTLTVGKASQSLVFDTIVTHNILESSFVMHATATSGRAVAYKQSDTSKIRISGDTAYVKDTGCVSVTASVTGNTNYDSAVSVSRSFCIVPVPLDIPVLIVEASERINRSVSPSLKWHKVNHAATYEVLLSTDIQFTAVVIDSIATDTVKIINNLATSTKYYWKVRAINRYNTSAFSAIDSFVTVPQIPSVPVLIVNDTDRTDRKLAVSLYWHKSERADNYRFQLSEVPSFSGMIMDSALTDTTVFTDSLEVDKKYYWRVLASNAGGSSAFSSADSFTTIAKVLDAPVILTVVPQTERVGVNITLDWKAVTDAIEYRVVIAKDSVFTSVVIDTLGNAMLSLRVSGLLNNQTYYWHVYAKAGKNRSAWSVTEKFTTVPTEAVVNKSSSSAIVSGNTSVTPEVSVVSDSTNAIRNQVITIEEVKPENKTVAAISPIIDLSKSTVKKLSTAVTIEYKVPRLTVNGVSIDSAMKRNIRAYYLDESGNMIVVYGSKVDSAGKISISLDTLRRLFFAIDTIPPFLVDNTSDSPEVEGTIPAVVGMCGDNVKNTKYMAYYRKGGDLKYDSVEITSVVDKNFSMLLGQKAKLDSCGLEYYLSAYDGTNSVVVKNENMSTVLLDRKALSVFPEMKWTLFSVPVKMTNDSISGIYDSMLGDYGKKWRMFRYDNLPVDTLVEYKYGLTNIEPGKSYWMKTRKTGSYPVFNSGVTSPVNKCHEIVIPARKWIAFGNPFMFPVAWKNILDSSKTNGSVLIGPYTYSDSAWTIPLNIDRIDPWKGYYAFNNSDIPVTMRIPSIRYGTSLAKKATARMSVLEFVVKNDDEISCNNQLGFMDSISDGYDPDYDYPKPASPEDAVNAYFYREELKKVSGKFQSDFTSLKNGGATWHIKVANLRNGVPYFCHINNIDQLPDSLLVYAVDMESGTKWDMRMNDYGITGTKNVSEVNVELIVGTAAYVNSIAGIYKMVPMAFGVTSLYPNPVRHMARINYTIPYDPTRLRVPVAFTVYTMSGRKVFEIREQARSAGYYSILVDVTRGHNALSSGTYLYKLTAGRNWKSQVMKVVR